MGFTTDLTSLSSKERERARESIYNRLLPSAAYDRQSPNHHWKKKKNQNKNPTVHLSVNKGPKGFSHSALQKQKRREEFSGLHV